MKYVLVKYLFQTIINKIQYDFKAQDQTIFLNNHFQNFHATILYTSVIVTHFMLYTHVSDKQLYSYFNS